MTDQQKHTDRHGDELYLYSDPAGEDIIGVYARQVVAIPAGALLAMIDRAAPDAMRAYLRETLDALPEADSPEDVTETRVDRRYCDPLTDEEREQLREAGRTLGDAWRTFTEAVREGQFGATR